MIIGYAHRNASCQPAVFLLGVTEKVRRGLLDIKGCRIVAQDKMPCGKLRCATRKKMHVHYYRAVGIGHDGQDVPRWTAEVRIRFTPVEELPMIPSTLLDEFPQGSKRTLTTCDRRNIAQRVVKANLRKRPEIPEAVLDL